MLPTDNEGNSDLSNVLSKDITELNNEGSEVSTRKIVEHMLADFTAKGGEWTNAHIMSESEIIKNHFKRLLLEANHDLKNKYNLIHGGKKVSAIKANSVSDCLNKNSVLGIKMEDLENGQTMITFRDQEMLFDESTFAPVKSFVEQICLMVEYSKLQYKSVGRNLYINHLSSFNNIKDSQYKPQLMSMLGSGLGFVQDKLKQVFGEDSVHIMVTQFKESKNDFRMSSSLPIDHSRVLAQAGPDVGVPASSKSSDFGKSIKYCATIGMLFLYAYACIYIYLIEVYKDSLVYSKFLSNRKK